MTLENIISIVFGGAGITSFILALIEKKNAAKLTDANYTKMVQDTYTKFVVDTNNKIAQLEGQISMLLQVVEGYKEKCKNCAENSARK